jgi:hypothetical protein
LILALLISAEILLIARLTSPYGVGQRRQHLAQQVR